LSSQADRSAAVVQAISLVKGIRNAPLAHKFFQVPHIWYAFSEDLVDPCDKVFYKEQLLEIVFNVVVLIKEKIRSRLLALPF